MFFAWLAIICLLFLKLLKQGTMKTSTSITKEHYEALNLLDAKKKANVIIAILELDFYGNEINLQDDEKALFSVIRSTKKTKAAKERKAFVTPTLEEITEYCNERNNLVDPNKFLNYYTSNGWKVGGKTPMKDWRAAVRTWESNAGFKATPKEKIDITRLIKSYCDLFNTTIQSVPDEIHDAYAQRIKEGFTFEAIENAMWNILNNEWYKEKRYSMCTFSYFCRQDILSKFSGERIKDIRIVSMPTVQD